MGATQVRISFTVPGEPTGKGRPRFARAGKFVRTYTPAETARFEDRVRFFYQAQYKGRMLSGALQMNVFAYHAMPKSMWRKKAPLGETLKTTKPDCDNIVKLLSDALNGIAYRDDAQIVTVLVVKKYAAQGEQARTVIEIEEVGDEKKM